MKNGSFLVGDWRVEPNTNLLLQNGTTVRLEPKVMSLLVFLSENAGEVVSKDKLLEAVWEDVFVTEQVLKVSVSELRKALDDDAKNPRFINTIPKKGYQLIAEVKPFEEIAEVETAKSKNWFWAGGVLALVVIGAIAFWFLSTSQTPAKSVNSIAVLPLRDISENEREEFFSEGLTEAIITNLARGNLKVISPRSTLVYKNSDKKASQIAAELNVETLLEGTILRSGEKIRLSINLIDGKTEQVLWAESYERNLSEILELQAKFSQDIARQINLKLSPQTPVIAKVNPEAYENYLKGRYLWNQRTHEGIQKSIDYYKRAIELAPDTSFFHSGLADSYILLAFYSPNGSREFYEKGKESALKALELDKDSAKAHTSLAGVLHKYELDWAGAEHEFQKAIEINPNYPTAHQWYAIYLMAKGEHEKALAEINKALELDPFSLVMRGDKGWLLYVAGRYDEAIEQFKAVNELDSNRLGSYLLILAYCKKEKFDEAFAEVNLELKRKGENPFFLSLLIYAEALAGRKNEALANLEKLKKMPQNDIPAFQYALVYSALSDKERAIDYLEKVVENRSSWQPFLKNEPSLESLRTHPRFQKLMNRLGFPLTP